LLMPQEFAATVKPATMDFVVNGIRHVCNTFKRRSPGTRSERDAQDYFAKELGQWADDVNAEDFHLRPYAFLGFFAISVVLGIAGSVVFFFNRTAPSVLLTVISFSLLLLSMIIVLFEFILYRQFVDFLFPKGTSTFLSSRRSNISLEMKMAVNKEVRIPMIRVVAKPCMGPEPKM